ncbi:MULTISPECIES: hypothetical protein [unclassified Mucilaginibacter]|uniref:hypothetical protein n=1 Tax=unclassified Mucilaginibacter TaxID=2617802 RepID=UPI002AC93932|nr:MULTISPECIES: hypothetical protein [unclassified Mucilaginibacter]MEB0261606.1 hypothetical protein [Mucilaginibacter sp. 10I4]MEB0277140.1 hypothetical protein [Mucilaginibacter sp. 10B2]MEB0301414.1 hypothetical protein [Mucilaginibacter sp. 5C4]WPX25240.1 hypothetical protein RHM67_08165 [Mucilaginibacter sp. 5C4]
MIIKIYRPEINFLVAPHVLYSENVLKDTLRRQKSSLIQNVFSGFAKVNITYSDDMNLIAGQKGFTPPPSSLDPNGNLTITVNLNKNELPNSSQEFIQQ